MFRGLYLVGLLLALGGLAVVDWKYKLALWHDRKRALATVGIGLAFFLAWDIAGIVSGIFYIGSGEALTGLNLAPELPLEEPVFLALLMYQTLILWQLFRRWHAR